MTQVVTYSTDNQVAIITLNQPQAMNAFDHAMREQMTSAQVKAEQDDTIRVIVLTETEKCFSSGTDLKEALGQEELFDISITGYKPIIDNIENSKKTYIAAKKTKPVFSGK